MPIFISKVGSSEYLYATNNASPHEM